ncbi:MAG TPA: hypothetical protein VIN34_01365 [Candidatus Limnocylindria bacterium]|jgi:hypothetical protein
MKKLISVATLSALLAVGAFASITAFAANAPASGPGIILSQPSTPPEPSASPEPATEPAETPGTESATEPAEATEATEPAEATEAPGDTGHADDPANTSADHQFEGTE